MKRKEHKRRRGGYTMAELLIAVALIAILAGIAIPSVISSRRSLKMTEFDDDARTIYLAAQNNLTALRAASETLTGDFADVPDGAVSALSDDIHLKYVSTDDPSTDPSWLVPFGSVDSALMGPECHYLVEFDPASGIVYGVFYTEDSDGKALTPAVYQDVWSFVSGGKSCRTRDGRNAFAGTTQGFLLGYYGADGAVDFSRPEALKVPKPKVKLINAEELVLEFGATAESGVDTSRMFYTVSITGPGPDGSEHTVQIVEKGKFNSGATNKVVLDTLKESVYSTAPSAPAYGGWTVGDKFADWARESSWLKPVIMPGADITITVSLACDAASGEGIAALPQSTSFTTNSLFAQRDGDTVQIGYGRHLQNLHQEPAYEGPEEDKWSLLDRGITKAVLVRDIDFAENTPEIADDTLEWWDETYGYSRLLFTPINSYYSNALTDFDGAGFVIQNLNAGVENGSSALFGGIPRGTVRNVTLVDAKTSYANLAGSLAAWITNPDVVVDGCRSYLTDYSDASARVQGGVAGGLIGSAVGCQIQNSFAATVVSGGDVGGIFAGGNASLTHCYAAGYLSGDRVGGLAANAWDGVDFVDCYAAGVIAKATSSAAGLTPGVGKTTNCYAAVEYIDVPEEGASGILGYFTGVLEHTYYLAQPGVEYQRNYGQEWPGVTAVKATGKMLKSESMEGLGSAFHEGDNAAFKAYPYNFPGAGGARTEADGTLLKSPYPYPTLTDLPHYGDWLVVDAEPSEGKIAYYEKTPDGTYTFSYHDNSAGELQSVSTLSGTTALERDGYAYLTPERLADAAAGTATAPVYLALNGGARTVREATYLTALNADLTPFTGDVNDEENPPAWFVYLLPDLTGDVFPADFSYDSADNYYAQLTLSGDEEEMVGVTDAWLNPLFGDEAYNGASRPARPATVGIRSVRQLDGIHKSANKWGVSFRQERDIDGGVYTGAQGGKYAMETLYQRSSSGSPLYFGRTYNGNGRLIKNLSITSIARDGNTNFAGLFFRLRGGSAKLQNITMTDCTVTGKALTEPDCTGALVGRMESGVIENCTVRSSEIKVSDDWGNGGHVGGLVGYLNNQEDSSEAKGEKAYAITGCTVENCTVAGSNAWQSGKGAWNVGGLVGYVSHSFGLGGTISGCEVKNTTVTGMYVPGEDFANASVYKIGATGGFIGVWQTPAGASLDGAVQSCAVTGVTVKGKRAVGGFVGALDDGTENVAFGGASEALGCTAVNTAVTGGMSTGGFAGVIRAGVLQNCAVHLVGEGDKKAAEYYDTAAVTGASSWETPAGGFVGGFAGEMKNAKATLCHASVKVSGVDAGGFAGKIDQGSAVRWCYAGGHTVGGMYPTSAPNVLGSASAGGFAAAVSAGQGAVVNNCYTTCSTKSNDPSKVGVFIQREANGQSVGSTVSDNRALCDVFLGDGRKLTLTELATAQYNPFGAVVERTVNGDEAGWPAALPYDTSLDTGFPYTRFADVNCTVGGATVDVTELVHHGDWPEPPRSILAYFEKAWDASGYSYAYRTKGDASQIISTLDDAGHENDPDYHPSALEIDGYAYLCPNKLHTNDSDPVTVYISLDGGEFEATTVHLIGRVRSDLSHAETDADTDWYAYMLPNLSPKRIVSMDQFYNRIKISSDTAGKANLADQWFNPDFAVEAYSGYGDACPEAPQEIRIRSVRQLNNIRENYSAKGLYTQERDIDGSKYRGYMEKVDSKLTVAGMRVVVGDDLTWTDYTGDTLPMRYRLAFKPQGIKPSEKTAAEGKDQVFFGKTYDGKKNTISNLKIESLVRTNTTDSRDFAGLFYRLKDGTLKNIRMRDCAVLGPVGVENDNTGALVGMMESGTIDNCIVSSCQIAAATPSDNAKSAGGHLGGLVGWISFPSENNTATIQNSVVESCTVNGGTDTVAVNVGGLVGFMDGTNKKGGNDCQISGCIVRSTEVHSSYNAGAKSNSSNGNVGKYGSVGGFVGVWYTANGNTATIEACRVEGQGDGDMTVTGKQFVGGFVGIMTAENGKGFIGGDSADKGCQVINTKVQGDYTPPLKSGNVAETETKWMSGVGGFVGHMRSGTIRYSGVHLKQQSGGQTPDRLYDGANVVGENGANAGGFAGGMVGGTVEYCHAAVQTVGRKAGGFVGQMGWSEMGGSQGTISNSYAGGHTKNGNYDTTLDNIRGDRVGASATQAGAPATQTGGFAGSYYNGAVNNCYTTCSVYAPDDAVDGIDVFANLDGTAGTRTVSDVYAFGPVSDASGLLDPATHNDAGAALTLTPNTEAKPTAYPYDTMLRGRGYPYLPIILYPGGGLMPHYGDWYTTEMPAGEPDWSDESAVPVHTDSSYPDLGTQAAFSGDTLYVRCTVHGADSLSWTGPGHIGLFAITTDLGYQLLFRARDDGTVESNTPGLTASHTDGVDDHGNPVHYWVFSIPANQMPPYHSSVNVGFYMDDGYLVGDITNALEGGTNEVFDAARVAIDGDFSEWKVYPHTTLDTSNGGDANKIYGHSTGSLYVRDGIAYLHVIVDDATIAGAQKSNVNELALMSFSFSAPGAWPSFWYYQTALNGSGYYELSNNDGVFIRTRLKLESNRQEAEIAVDLHNFITNVNDLTELTVHFDSLGKSITVSLYEGTGSSLI